MADDPHGPGSDELHEDPLVTQLVSDPTRLPKLSVLEGWVGRSLREGYRRLYITPTFDSYVEFAASDVVYHKAATGDLGGTIVWLRDEATVDLLLGDGDTRAEFLTGEITVRYMPEATDGGPVIVQTLPMRRLVTRAGCRLGTFSCRPTPVTRSGCPSGGCFPW
jgi:hypothetical protein